jgi:hypothetical protein
VSSSESDDGTRTGTLLDEITHPIASLTAEGGCDQARVYEAVDECHSDPGYRGAFDGGLGRVRRDHSETAGPANPRRSLSAVGWVGKTQGARIYRAKVEVAIGRYKRVIGDVLRSRSDETEATEVAIRAVALARMLECGRPNYVRIA